MSAPAVFLVVKACLKYNAEVIMYQYKEEVAWTILCPQVNSAWILNLTKSQWVDLGIHTEACMTRPETCGAAGGAFSMWVKVIDCPSPVRGIISSRVSSGSVFYCVNEVIGYDTYSLFR